MQPKPWKRPVLLAAALATALTLFVWPDALTAAWNEITALITIEGEPVAASPALISDHEVREIEGLPPQAQAERLLERAINHYDGATELIAKNIGAWRGKISMEGTLNGLFQTALDANDLRVRAAAVELYLAAYDIGSTPDDLERIMARCDERADGRPHDLFVVGLLGNRGVEPERAVDYLLRWLNDADAGTRQWAVEGLAMSGSDAAIGPLLRVFHDDPSAFIRERAACGLAQSGMFTARQRRSAIPELLGFADDLSLDDETRGWVFQALQDISGERLSNDVRAWRDWWGKEREPAAREVS